MLKKQEALSYPNTYCLRGILALMVLVGHLSSLIVLIQGTLIYAVLSSFGMLAVNVFFFLSAYGLSSQVQKKGDSYLQGFVRRKIIPFYVYCIVVCAIYIVVKLALGLPVTKKKMLLSLVLIDQSVTFGWFLTVILGCYFLFWFVFKACKKTTTRWSMVLAALVVYYIIGTVFKIEGYWYVSVFSFALGLIWKEKESRIQNLFAKKKFMISFALALFILFGISFILGSTLYIPMVGVYFAQNIMGLSFVVLMMIFLQFIPIQNAVTRFLGKINLEIYVFQGLFFALLKDSRFAVHPWFVQAPAILLATILFAWLMHPVMQWIQKKTAQLLMKKS